MKRAEVGFHLGEQKAVPGFWPRTVSDQKLEVAGKLFDLSTRKRFGCLWSICRFFKTKY